MTKTVTIEINQQQAQMLDRLVADGSYGETYADVVRAGLVSFCEAHPEFLEQADREQRP
jgi:Arc/MetJ-type ribon-helix-helix transcriptional regulator